jgi:pentatricopeptide repeat protein
MPVELTTIVSILCGLFLSGRTVAAMEQLHEMIKRGMKVGIDTYNMILRGLFKK